MRGHSLKAIEVAANQILIVNFEELPVIKEEFIKYFLTT
ncbi:hypothetical protein JCM19239_7834 [Vibrio variabilis]|uniref:Uncharacterized protein n=1 Tax=Vibrio variabilis TaxID=990271 RepID=A0ABQ0JMI2_9VIBR|nr:hypothetical protein JCM19239_7834 [Vibrio variabilis]